MKKKSAALLLVLAVIFSLVSVFTVSAKDETVYVSPLTGNDEASGAKDAPFKTFDRAFDNVTADNLNIVLLDSITLPETESKTYVNNKTNAKNTVITGITPDVTLDFSNFNAVVMRRRVSYDNITLNFQSGTSYYVSGHTVTFGEGVSMPNRIILYAGGFWGDVSSTDLTVLGGKYSHIFGGGYYSKVIGNTDLTVGGNVNISDKTASACPCLIFGGGDRGAVQGSSNISFSDNAIAHYLIGSGHVSGDTVAGGSYINISGGKVMNVYGGSAGENAPEVTADTHITMTGGLAEALFGGSENKGMTGNTYIYVAGGDVSRRIFGGCYNDWGFSWDSDYYVSGSTNVILAPEAKLITGTELASGERDNMGIFIGSRRKENHADEVSTVLYLSGCDEALGDRSGWSNVFGSHDDYTVKSKANTFKMSSGYTVKKGDEVKGTFSSLGLAFAECKSAGEGFGVYASDGTTVFVSGDENYDPEAKSEAVEGVKALISEIGEVTYSEESLQKIKAAEKAYYALSGDEKALVTNVGVLKSAREKYNESLTPLSADELVIAGKNVCSADANGETLKKYSKDEADKGVEADLTGLIDCKEENLYIGAAWVGNAWKIYNTPKYDIDIELDGTETFSGMRVYHKKDAWSNWDGILNDWNVHVMFKGETEWKKLAYDYNRKVDKNGNQITNVPNGSIGATSTLFGYNVTNVSKVRFEVLNIDYNSGNKSYLVIPEIALIKADGTKTTFSASADIDDVNTVIVAIDKLGSAALTNKFYSDLSTIEKAYAALTEHRKTLVINYAKLQEARKAYDDLLKAALTLDISADSGVYSDGSGVIRFISTFGTIPETAEIESYGTYVLNLKAFTSNIDWKESRCATFTESEDGAPASDEAFAVDLMVPKDKVGTDVVAISFVKLKGSDNLIPTFFTEGVNVLGINTPVKNLGDR